MMTIMLLTLTACGGGSESGETENNENIEVELSDEIKDEGIFRVGMECAYPPYNWTQLDDSNGAVPIQGENVFASGYDVEFAKRIADGLGLELEIVKIEWNGLEPALRSGRIDAIIAGMSPTAERKENADFSDAYYNTDLVMIIKNGSPYANATSLEDFEGAKITGQLNTLHYDAVDQIPGVDKQEAMDDFAAMRAGVQSGILDGYVSEKPEGISAKAANPDFDFVEFDEGKGFNMPPEDTTIAVALRKGSALTQKVNEILAGIDQAERDSIMEDAIKHQPANQ